MNTKKLLALGIAACAAAMQSWGAMPADRTAASDASALAR